MVDPPVKVAHRALGVGTSGRTGRKRQVAPSSLPALAGRLLGANPARCALPAQGRGDPIRAAGPKPAPPPGSGSAGVRHRHQMHRPAGPPSRTLGSRWGGVTRSPRGREPPWPGAQPLDAT